MRAAVLTRFGGPDAVELRDVADPLPGPGDVRLRVTAAAVNNTDVWTREGAYGLPGDPGALAGWLGPVAFPRIQGADVVGRVDLVGDGVDPGWVGRRVLVDPGTFDLATDPPRLTAVLGSEEDGGFAELVVVPLGRVYDVTASPLSDPELACLPIAYGTATGMLERGGVVADELVLVTGASGGVGLAAVQLAAARGARVVAQTTPDKADLVRAAGATSVVDRDAGGLEDLAPDGLDAVVDVVAGPQVDRLLPRLRPGGRWIVAGAVAGPVVQLDLRRLYLHDLRLVGSTMHTPAHFAVLVDQALAGGFRPRVAATYPLEELHAAHAALERRDHVGKIVVLP
ncbi:zinc-binding dehydrogenase [Nocardioides sp. AX2bis]|uniref:zinc-binding dehydrogenase n=1 Tax=Nocardioides sp. AX2bis TaxID=2653157 RepID=UPI0012F0BCE5|nr:zinc-binding dehydrogenase [Nocardioides sp. AX2bis]VXB63508.1 NADPH:quinone reductase [Nocardioides sp. AX2bis]